MTVGRPRHPALDFPRRFWAVGLLAASLVLLMGELVARQIDPLDPGLCKEPRLFRRSADPRLMWELVPGATVADHGVVYRINADGLRGAEVAVSKPGGVVRVLALGDTETFGYGVSEELSLPRQLEERLNRRGGGATRFEVLNAGVNAYNTYQELAWLEEHGLGFEPDLVIINFHSHNLVAFWDAVDLFCLDGPIAVPPGFFVGPRVDILVSGKPQPWSQPWLKEQVRLYHLAASLRHNVLLRLGQRPWAQQPPPPLEYYYPHLDDYEHPYWQWYRRLMGRMREVLAARGVPLVVWVAISELEAADPPATELGRHLERFARETGIPIMLPWPVLAGRDIGSLFDPGGHFTAEAYVLMAAALDQLIADRALIPPAN